MTRTAGVAVVGSGPNGLAAAVTMARAGLPVTVFEAADTIGGGTRTTELVQPGVQHDVCSAIHPMALATGFFRAFQLERRVRFAVPDASYASPLDDRPAAIAYRDLDRTAAELGRDGNAYRDLYRPLLHSLDGVIEMALGGSMLRMPRDLTAAVALAARVLEEGTALWNLRFRESAAPALLAGVAAHSIGPMPRLSTAAVGLVLGALGHADGWPVPIGGSRVISDALVADLRAHGGRIETAHEIQDVRELAGFRTVMFDTSARGLARIAQRVLPSAYRRRLLSFQYGNGATKVDFVLDGPAPWRDPRVAETPTVHIGGDRSEIARAEREVARGRHPERPYVLLAQTARFDPSRNPTGTEAIWSYTHVPRGSDVDVSEAVLSQLERFAPGFRERIVALRVTTAHELSRYNANYHGGDFSAGAVTMRQLLARPTLSTDPWRTPAPGIYLCSSSTPPGPGVHGLAGWYAARSALRHDYGITAVDLSAGASSTLP